MLQIKKSMKLIMISYLKSRGAASEHRRLKEKGTLQIGTKIPGTGTITPQTGTVTQKTEKIGKVHMFREGHKILRNLHRRFDRYYIGQIYGRDFAKNFGLLKTYEPYVQTDPIAEAVVRFSNSRGL